MDPDCPCQGLCSGRKDNGFMYIIKTVVKAIKCGNYMAVKNLEYDEKIKNHSFLQNFI